MRSSTTTHFGRCREQVRELASGEDPMSSVEALLRTAPLATDEKDALWLLAWLGVETGGRPSEVARLKGPGG